MDKEKDPFDESAHSRDAGGQFITKPVPEAPDPEPSRFSVSAVLWGICLAAGLGLLGWWVYGGGAPGTP